MMSPRPTPLFILIGLSGSLLMAAAAAHAWTSAPAPGAAPSTGSHLPLPSPLPDVAAQSGELVTATLMRDRDAVAQSSDGLVRMQLTVKSHHPLPEGERRPTDLHVVLDRSGSMTGAKMEDARAAALALIGQLGPEDRIALHSYANGVRTDIPLSAANDSGTTWMRVVQGIQANGSTNMHAGLQAALDGLRPMSGRASRVILISDGLPDSPDGLDRLALAAAVSEAPLTTIGIGDDYNEQLMTTLASQGTGNFYWVADRSTLSDAFAAEFDAATETVATGLAARFHAGPGVALVSAGGLPIQHEDSPHARVNLGSLYAGQQRTLWLTVAVPTGSATDALDLGEIRLSWRDLDGHTMASASNHHKVAVVASADQATASLRSGVWAQGVLDEVYTTLQNELASHVRSGDMTSAKDSIERYRTQVTALNDSVGSTAVTDNLTSLGALEAEIEEQFRGPDQHRKQNVWSKGQVQQSYTTKNAGSSKRY
jgi:Ca-activated chloride channel homolog